MKKNKKGKSPQNSEVKKRHAVTIEGFEKDNSTSNEPGAANPDFPQEYEEQVSTDIRMKPQPLIKPEKKGD